jgi:hypothetical protein
MSSKNNIQMKMDIFNAQYDIQFFYKNVSYFFIVLWYSYYCS